MDEPTITCVKFIETLIIENLLVPPLPPKCETLLEEFRMSKPAKRASIAKYLIYELIIRRVLKKENRIFKIFTKIQVIQLVPKENLAVEKVELTDHLSVLHTAIHCQSFRWHISNEFCTLLTQMILASNIVNQKMGNIT